MLPLDPARETTAENCSALGSAINSPTGSPGGSSTDSPGVHALTARRLCRLSEIGLALSAEQDIHRLLALILSTSRELTSADGGTLYIVEKEPDGSKKLYFRAAQNDSIVVDTTMSFAVGPTSLAGYAAASGLMLRFDDVYQLPSDAPYRFNPAFDVEHSYRTRSVLVVPLQNHEREIIGVLQLINCKRNRETLLRDAETIEREVIGFDDETAELAATLASQAAVALDNFLLVREIESLFESFVAAALTAIEERDPTTSGHSQRVTLMTLALAHAVSAQTDGPYRDVAFTTSQLRELRYAGLLHDFGKIGVRESILTKSHRLEQNRFEALRTRLLALRHEWEKDALRAELMSHSDPSLSAAQRSVQIEAARRTRDTKIAQLEADLAILERINAPAKQQSSEGMPSHREFTLREEALERLSSLFYTDGNGQRLPVLSSDEREALSVYRGTLTPAEFRQVQEHAEMSYAFLGRIPWTASLAQVPDIARSHHEKLDGSGYPQGLRGEQIPLGARLMTVADIYDALTATDRSYRQALSHVAAMEVLRSEAVHGLLDAELVQIFERANVHLAASG